MKCSNCKCFKKPDDFTLLKNGNMKKTCNKCSKNGLITDKKNDKSTDKSTDKNTDIMIFLIHKKKIHNVVVDIRDRWNPSEDKEWSYYNTNEWFSTFVI